MKKINLTFCILITLTAVAAVLHTGIVYLNMVLAPVYASSAPAEVTFFLLVPYALGILFLLLTWLIARKICRIKYENDAR